MKIVKMFIKTKLHRIGLCSTLLEFFHFYLSTQLLNDCRAQDKGNIVGVVRRNPKEEMEYIFWYLTAHPLNKTTKTNAKWYGTPEKMTRVFSAVIKHCLPSPICFM